MAIFHDHIHSGKKGTAKQHVDYIARLGRYRHRTDLIHSESGNLPDWAQGNPAVFFYGADLYERANGAAYREHTIALPAELTIEQNIDLARKIAKDLIGNKPYMMAIHMNEGSLSGAPNPHMHLMWSDRVPDGITRTQQQTFKRANSAHPEAGGCRKDSGGKSQSALRDEVIATRQKIADIQNEALATYGHSARVDHRSNVERGINRTPDRHLGPAEIKYMSAEEKKAYVDARDAAR